MLAIFPKSANEPAIFGILVGGIHLDLPRIKVFSAHPGLTAHKEALD
jgi:hypothetical protein